MASVISAGTSTGTALNLTGDTSGILQLASNNGTVGLTVDTSQNVGIGTSSPNSKLEVQQGTKATTAAVISSARFTTTDASAFGLYFRQKTDATAANRWTGISSFDNGVGPAPLVFQDLGGNVGIGQTNPATQLDISGGSTYNRITLRNPSNESDGSTYISGNKDGTTGDYANLALAARHAITFSSNSSEKMRIDSSGNLLVGTTTSSTGFSELVINGNNNQSHGYNAGIQLNYGTGAFGGGAITTQSAAGGGLNFYTYTGNIGSETYLERMRIDSGGALLVGATSVLTSGDKFEVSINGSVRSLAVNSAGNVYAYSLGTGIVYSNAGVLTSTNPSDSRLKDNITDISWGLSQINQLRPVSYDLKTDTIGQGTQYGFIAQEVQSVMPELVKTFKGIDDIEYLGLDKEGIYATLVKAIQEQQALITQLQADVAALKGAK